MYAATATPSPSLPPALAAGIAAGLMPAGAFDLPSLRRDPPRGRRESRQERRRRLVREQQQRKEQLDREARELRVVDGTVGSTTDPTAAAQVWETPDYSWRFPQGGKWEITRSNCRRWYFQEDCLAAFFRDPALVAAMKEYDDDLLFLLRLDLLEFAWNVHDARWDDDRVVAELTRYLSPGRDGRDGNVRWGWMGGEE